MQHEITDERMKLVAGLIGHIVNLGQQFKIYPPAEVTREPGILKSDEVAEKLAGTKWWLSLADGEEELLSFTELMVLSYELAMIQIQMLKNQGGESGKIEIDLRVNLAELMAPEHVKILLSKLRLEGIS